MYLLALLLTIALAAQIPYFTAFDLDSSIDRPGLIKKYKMEGEYCQNFDGNCYPSTFIVEPAQERMMWDLGPLGTWVTLSTGVYVYNQAQFPTGTCSQMIGRNYSTERAGYTSALSMPDSRFPGRSSYYGYINVADACGHFEGVHLELLNNVITQASWILKVALPDTCFPYNAIMENDYSTLDHTSNFDSYFALPSGCDTPLDYCAVTYPVGNSCAICTDCPTTSKRTLI